MGERGRFGGRPSKGVGDRAGRVSESGEGIIAGQGGPVFLEGQRNNGLTKLAGDLVRRGVQAGLSLDEMKALVRHRNEQTCLPPLPQAEVDAITTSVYRAEQKKRPDRQIRLLNRDEIDHLRDPEFLIDGMLVKNSVAILFGEPGVAKTFIALSFAISVATGGTWFGRRVSKAPVVYVSGEGSSGINQRINAYEFTSGVRATDLFLVDEAIGKSSAIIYGPT